MVSSLAMDRGLGLKMDVYIAKDTNLACNLKKYKTHQGTVNISGLYQNPAELNTTRMSWRRLELPFVIERFSDTMGFVCIERHHLPITSQTTNQTQMRNSRLRKSFVPALPALWALVLWSGLLSPSCPLWASCPLPLILWSDSVRFRCILPFWKRREENKGIYKTIVLLILHDWYFSYTPESGISFWLSLFILFFDNFNKWSKIVIINWYLIWSRHQARDFTNIPSLQG